MTKYLDEILTPEELKDYLRLAEINLLNGDEISDEDLDRICEINDKIPSDYYEIERIMVSNSMTAEEVDEWKQ